LAGAKEFKGVNIAKVLQGLKPTFSIIFYVGAAAPTPLKTVVRCIGKF
jgi:hypothetical protein